MMPIFHWLVSEAAEFKAARCLHQKIVTLDSHCDSPMILAPQQVDWAEAFSRRNPDLLVDLQKMDEGHLDGTIMVAYLAQGARDEEERYHFTHGGYGCTLCRQSCNSSYS